MASPFVEHHAPRLAAALAGFVEARGFGPVDVAELAERSGVPASYVRAIARRYLDDVNAALAREGLKATADEASWWLWPRFEQGRSAM